MPRFAGLLPALVGLALVQLAAPVQAGVILIPITEVVATEPGNTTIRSLPGGRYQLTTRDLNLTGTVSCEGNLKCLAAGLDGTTATITQSLRIVIDLSGDGISGQTRGEIVLPDTARVFQGSIDGKVRCEPGAASACARAILLVRARVQLTEDLDTPLAGIMDLEWVGTIQPPIEPLMWQGITGLGELALFDSDFSLDSPGG